MFVKLIDIVLSFIVCVDLSEIEDKDAGTNDEVKDLDDYDNYTELKCNKKLNRCTNVYASLQACGETKCPTGCCYSDVGFTTLRCLTIPEAAKCGLCVSL